MKQVLFYMLLIFVTISVTGCKKSMEDPTGDLVVNARDGAGISLVGKTVYLYDNQYDFDNFLCSDTQVTDNSGQVRFEFLTPAVYYFDCEFVNTYGETVVLAGSANVYEGNETTFTLMP